MMGRRRFTDKQLDALRYRDPAQALVYRVTGLKIVRACPFCKYMETAPLGRGKGRGYGLAVGGGMSSKVAAHIRHEHADILEAMREERDRLTKEGIPNETGR